MKSQRVNRVDLSLDDIIKMDGLDQQQNQNRAGPGNKRQQGNQNSSGQGQGQSGMRPMGQPGNQRWKSGVSPLNRDKQVGPSTNGMMGGQSSGANGWTGMRGNGPQSRMTLIRGNGPMRQTPSPNRVFNARLQRRGQGNSPQFQQGGQGRIQGNLQRQGILTNQRQGILTNQRQGILTNKGQGILTNQRQGILTNKGQGILTNQRQGILTNKGQGIVINQRQGILTNQRQGIVINQRQGLLTTKRQGILTNQRQGILTNQRQGILTNQRQGIITNQRPELLANLTTPHNGIVPTLSGAQGGPTTGSQGGLLQGRQLHRTGSQHAGTSQQKMSHLSLDERRQQAFRALRQARQTIAQLDQQAARQNLINARRGLTTQGSGTGLLNKDDSMYGSSLSLASNVSRRSTPSGRRLQGTQITSFSARKSQGSPQRPKRWQHLHSSMDDLDSASTLTISIDNSAPFISHADLPSPLDDGPAPPRPQAARAAWPEPESTSWDLQHSSLSLVSSPTPADSDPASDLDLSRGATPQFSQQVAQLKPTVSMKYMFQPKSFSNASSAVSLNDRFSLPASEDPLDRKVFM